MVAAAIATGAKGARSLDLARAMTPERFPSAFGTLAGTAATRATLEGLEAAAAGVAPETRTLYSYPADAWLYLALPGANVLPFHMILPGYSLPEHFQTVLDAIERRAADFVVVNLLLAKPDDAVVAAIRRRYGPGAPVFPIYEVFTRPSEPE